MSPAVVIAGGGTGGHVMPAVAVAQRLKHMAPGLRVVLIGTGSALEQRMAARYELKLVAVAAKGFVGKSLVGKAGALARVAAAVRGTRRLLKQLGARVVLGMGGYGCVAPVLAGRSLGLSMALQEQNAIPGLATKVLSPLVEVVFAGFGSCADHLKGVRVVISGNPVRSEVIAQAARAASARPGPSAELRIAVLGGSQGAQTLNELVPMAMKRVAERWKVVVRHQTGEGKAEAARAAWASLGIPAQVQEFCENVGEWYGWAHLVVCRAGAITISELMAVGRAAILVPYPYAGAHQRMNALAAARAGAAVVLQQEGLSPQALGELLLEVVEGGRLRRMEQAACRAARRDGAGTIAGWCLGKLEEARV